MMRTIYLSLLGVILTCNSYSQNNALHFDGVDDYVQAINGFSGDGDFTIELWFETDDIFMDDKGLFSFNDNPTDPTFLNLAVGNGQILYYAEPLNNPSSSWFFTEVFINANQCHHIALVKESLDFRMYLDGALIVSNANFFSDTFELFFQEIFLGTVSPSAPNTFWQGEIDEFRMWSYARSVDKIVAEMNLSLLGTEPNLVDYYSFDQGVSSGSNQSVTTLIDQSVNGNHGTLNNFSLSGATSNWVTSCADLIDYCPQECCVDDNEGFESFPIDFLSNQPPFQAPAWYAGIGSPAIIEEGCQDNNSVRIFTTNPIFFNPSVLSYTAGSGFNGQNILMEKDKYYCISVCAKAELLNTWGEVVFGFYTPGTPFGTYDEIGRTDQITDVDGWVTLQVPIWQADADYFGIDVWINGDFIPAQSEIDISLFLDNICIEETTEPKTCKADFSTIVLDCGKLCITDESCGENYVGTVSLDGVDLPDPINQELCLTLSQGTYEICLTVEGGGCTDTKCEDIFVSLFINDPTISCPPDQTVDTTPDDCGAYVMIEDPTFTVDDCVQSYTLECSRSDNLLFTDLFPIDPVTTITCTITDDQGQSASCSYKIVVEDNTPPVLPCPPDQSIDIEQGTCKGEFDFVLRNGFDNCRLVNIECSRSDGATFDDPWCLDETIVTCTAEDEAGNMSSCTTSITVIDIEPPAITCPQDITVTATDPTGTTIPWTDPTATDNCAVISLTCDYNDTSVFPCGETIVSCVTEDAAGLTDDCSYRVTINCEQPDDLCGKAVITCFSGLDGRHSWDLTPDPDGPVLGIIDIRDRSAAPVGLHWNNAASGMYKHPDWIARNLGEVFGIALDNNGYIYVTSTSSYGKHPYGPLGGGGVYKIDATLGTIFPLISLPNGNDPSKGAGLGNIVYSEKHDLLYVTNFYDGLIYAIDPSSGGIEDTFDPFLPSNVNPSLNYFAVPLGDRVWAVGIDANNQDRLYFSLWNQHVDDPSLAGPENEIYSVLLDPIDGKMVSSAIFEKKITEFTSNNSGQQNATPPISDIAFSSDGKMLLGSRGMSNLTRPRAHFSNVLEYEKINNIWELTSGHNMPYNVKLNLKFKLGKSFANSAGGVDYGYESFGSGQPQLCDEMVWATGDALSPTHGNPPKRWIYGVQGLSSLGGSANNSYLIDFNNNVIAHDKTQIGDVEIFKCIPCNMDTTDCMDITISYDHITIEENECCYSATLTNNIGPDITKICIDVENTPDWIINQGQIQTGYTWDFVNANTICIENNAGIPLGVHQDLFSVCLSPLANVQMPKDTQCLVTTYYKGEVPTICSDTLKTHCDAGKNPCVKIDSITVMCNPVSDYKYCICFDITNESDHPGSMIILNNLSPSTFAFTSGCGTNGAPYTINDWGFQCLDQSLQPDFFPGDKKTLCVEISTTSIISGPTQLSFLVSMYHEQNCCSEPELVEIEGSPCCDPCSSITTNIYPIESAVDDACCYSLDIEYLCDYSYFDKVELELLTGGVSFGSYSNGYPLDWSVSFTDDNICVEPNLLSSLPSGLTTGLIDFCLNDVNEPSEIPQTVKVNYYSNEEVVCDTIIQLNCPISKNPCAFVFDEQITCDKENKKYNVSVKVQNLSNSAFDAVQLIAIPAPPVLSTHLTPANFVDLTPALEPNQCTTFDFCYEPDVFPDQDGLLILKWLLKSEEPDTCCAGHETVWDTLYLPPCDTMMSCCDRPDFQQDIQVLLDNLSIADCKVTIDPMALDSCVQIEIDWGDGPSQTYPIDNPICHDYGQNGAYQICIDALVDDGMSSAPCLQTQVCQPVDLACPLQCSCGQFTNLTLTESGIVNNIQCGGNLVFPPSPSLGNVDIQGVFNCTGNCMTDEITWTLIGPGTNQSGILSTGSFILNLPSSYFSQFGTYELELIASCDGMNCTSCKIILTTRELVCDCGEYSNLILTTDSETYGLSCGNPSPPVLSICPHIDQLTSLTGTVSCMGSCDPSGLTIWIAGTTLPVTIDNAGVFNVDLTGFNFDTPGTHLLQLQSDCGMTKCPCPLEFVVPQECDCNCDDYYDNRPIIIQHSIQGNSCLREFSLANLGPCDTATWTISKVLGGGQTDPNPITLYSVGGETVSFIAEDGFTYKVFALTYRITPVENCIGWYTTKFVKVNCDQVDPCCPQFYHDGLLHTVIGDYTIDPNPVDDVICLNNMSDNVGIDVSLGHTHGYFYNKTMPPINSLEEGATVERRIYGSVDGNTDALVSTSIESVLTMGAEKYVRWTLSYEGSIQNELVVTDAQGATVFSLDIANDTPLYYRYITGNSDWDLPETNTEHNWSRSHMDNIILILPSGDQQEVESGSTVHLRAKEISRSVGHYSRVEHRWSDVDEAQFNSQGVIMFDDRIHNEVLGNEIFDNRESGQEIEIMNMPYQDTDGLKISWNLDEELDEYGVYHQNSWRYEMPDILERPSLHFSAFGIQENSYIKQLGFMSLEPYFDGEVIRFDPRELETDAITIQLYTDGVMVYQTELPVGFDMFEYSGDFPYQVDNMGDGTDIDFSYGLYWWNPVMCYLDNEWRSGDELRLILNQEEYIELESFRIIPSRFKSFVITNETLRGCFCFDHHFGMKGDLDKGFVKTVNGNEVCVQTNLSSTYACIREDLSRFTWDWGDGSVEAVSIAPYSLCHTYASDPSQYDINFTAEIYYRNGLCEVIEINENGIITSVHDMQNIVFDIYPNPTTDELTISMDHGINASVQIEVLSPLGQVVRLQEIQNGSRSHTMNIKDIESGIYFVILKEGETIRAQKKIIKL